MGFIKSLGVGRTWTRERKGIQIRFPFPLFGCPSPVHLIEFKIAMGTPIPSNCGIQILLTSGVWFEENKPFDGLIIIILHITYLIIIYA